MDDVGQKAVVWSFGKVVVFLFFLVVMLLLVFFGGRCGALPTHTNDERKNVVGRCCCEILGWDTLSDFKRTSE